MQAIDETAQAQWEPEERRGRRWEDRRSSRWADGEWRGGYRRRTLNVREYDRMPKEFMLMLDVPPRDMFELDGQYQWQEVLRIGRNHQEGPYLRRVAEQPSYGAWVITHGWRTREPTVEEWLAWQRHRPAAHPADGMERDWVKLSQEVCGFYKEGPLEVNRIRDYVRFWSGLPRLPIGHQLYPGSVRMITGEWRNPEGCGSRISNIKNRVNREWHREMHPRRR
jgi:hypothetical protein